ncbi:hypothetical protein ACH4E7_26175 [Kitasatospora sp. NPDC018058]|uniref:hypothetical protein n=1 Tax=Kitasatospora sp. NPDC018058 TaxID=3364025 RepID=UPI0037BEEB7C
MPLDAVEEVAQAEGEGAVPVAADSSPVCQVVCISAEPITSSDSPYAAAVGCGSANPAASSVACRNSLRASTRGRASAARAARPTGEGPAGYSGTVLAVAHDRWFAADFARYLVFGAGGEVHESAEPVRDEGRVKR